MYTYTDYFKEYGRIMQFNKNRCEPIHRWYPFVEGYSREFICSIIKELGKQDIVCLDPFSGSGTTPLELQNIGIKCFSFEVNPLMYLIGKAKMYTDYSVEDVEQLHKQIIDLRQTYKIDNLSSEFYTLYEGKDKEKWNYDTEAGIAVEKLRRAILSIKQEVYRDLFEVALASILLNVSNLYRNGKCLSYKDGWKKLSTTQEEVFKEFDRKIKCEVIPDIKDYRESIKYKLSEISNYDFLYNEDCRHGINNKIGDNSIDLVITSPPYLNSRDYTDTYMLELKTLRFTNSFEEITALRNKTIRSHVQVKWTDDTNVANEALTETLRNLKEAASADGTWNVSIIDMVRLYFVDMCTIFDCLYHKLKDGGRVYFNVSNSAYFGVMVNTLEICASLAENVGFSVIEIRKARFLKTSPQQKDKVQKLLEGVIVLEKRSVNE